MIKANRKLFGSDRGVIAPATALMLAVLLGMVGLVTDASIWYAQRRSLQGVTDAAALGSVREAYDATGARARARALAILSANGVNANDLVSLEVGYYCPVEDTTKQIFQSTPCSNYPTGAYRDAIRLQTKARGTIILSRLFTPSSVANRPITVTSTAALVNEAGLRAGSGLVTLGKEGIAAKTITALTGGTVTLSAVHYTGLANVNVDAIKLLNQIASVKGSIGTYDQLLNSDVTVGQLFQATISALNQQPNIATVDANALTALGLLANVSGMGNVRLSKLFDLGIWQDMKVTSPGSPTIPIKADINVYQLAMATLEVANGAHAVAIPSFNVADPTGIVSVSVKNSIIEPPVEPYFGFGPEGTSVHTAQIRLQLEAAIDTKGRNGGLLGSLLNPIINLQINLPLYIEVASGDAKIDRISCDYPSGRSTSVEVLAKTSVANVFLGEAPYALMSNFSRPINLSDLNNGTILSTSILGLNLAAISGKAQVSIGNPNQYSRLTFVPAPGPTSATQGIIGQPATTTSSAIAPVPATVSSTGLVGSLLGSLSTLPLLGPIANVVLTPLSSLVAIVDGVVDNLLQALGVRVGMMDVFVTGARCGVPVLVE